MMPFARLKEKIREPKSPFFKLYAQRRTPSRCRLLWRGMHSNCHCEEKLCFDAAIHVCFGPFSTLHVDRHRLRLRDDDKSAVAILMVRCVL